MTQAFICGNKIGDNFYLMIRGPMRFNHLGIPRDEISYLYSINGRTVVGPDYLWTSTELYRIDHGNYVLPEYIDKHEIQLASAYNTILHQRPNQQAVIDPVRLTFRHLFRARFFDQLNQLLREGQYFEIMVPDVNGPINTIRPEWINHVGYRVDFFEMDF